VCLAIPAKLIEVNGMEGVAEIGGTRRNVVLTLVEDPSPGQYVLLHAGYAIEIIDEKQAAELAEMHREILELVEDE
jgi:hydrogenase expression/formation protein HypC